MAGVARGVGRAVVRHPEIERRLREFFKDKANDARLKMAEVPEGAELILDPKLGFPTVAVDGIYILPGIPELFEQKFAGLRGRFLATPYVLRVVYTSEGEGAIAEHLNATLEAFPELLLGSYPRLDQREYAVKLTLESKDEAYVQAAFDHLVSLLPGGSVLRTE
jgi:molybdopterin-biosynthesis enzyme MoeA-like protein